MINVTNTGLTIKISDPLGVAPDAYIAKSDILQIGSYFQKNCVNGLGNSPYAYGKRTPGRTTKTIVRLCLHDSTTFNFDCDEVANQPTWQGCTLAALNQAVTDIESWL